jgi:hypothetical protein
LLTIFERSKCKTPLNFESRRGLANYTKACYYHRLLNDPERPANRLYNNRIIAITIIICMASPPMWKAKPPSSQLITSTTTIRYNKLLIVVQLEVGYNVSIYFSDKQLINIRL